MIFNQMVFGKDGEIIEPKRSITPENAKNYVASLEELKDASTQRAVCPFCIYESTLDKFIQFTSDNRIAKLFKCPVCGQEMRYQTLYVYDLGAEAYSEWVWTQIYMEKDRDRFEFDAIKRIMRQNGCATVFWDMQKRVKLKKDSGE